MINSEFLAEPFAQFLPTVFLYAELHFRFKWSGSRYFQKYPEILADLPIRIEPNRDIPIIFISEKNEASDIENRFNLGCVDYIPKPFSNSEVRARIKSQLKLRNYFF